MDIKQLIGETTDYDKKVALETKKPKSWCKSISAFANCYGGKLVFGVANDDALVGLSDAKGDAEKISEIIKTHLNPIPEFKLSFEKDNDKTFVIVEVMKGQQIPYYYEGDGQLIAFMRIGNESVPATPSQLRELVLRGSGESYDSYDSYATQANENVIEISEEKIKILMPEYSKKKLAKACEILKMISENPNISIDELRIALDVTDRTIARYISELKDKGIIERKGPDNGGEWKIK